jgi:heat shock protein beta
MDRIMKAQAYQKTGDPNNQFYANQKKTLEVNPRHPLIKELKRRVEDAKDDQTTKDLAFVLFETATLRSGYSVPDTADFAGRIERMLRLSMNVGLDEKIEDEPEEEEAGEEEKDDDAEEEEAEDTEAEKDDDDDESDKATHKGHSHDDGEL